MEADNKPKSKKPVVSNEDSICRLRKQKGYKTSNNKLCPNFKPCMTKRRKKAAEDAHQQALLDCIPINLNANTETAALLRYIGNIVEGDGTKEEN